MQLLFKITFIVIVTIYSSNLAYSQIESPDDFEHSTPPPPTGFPCECDYLLDSDISQSPFGGVSNIEGNLNEFVSFKNGECLESVFVFSNKLQKFVNFTNSLQSLVNLVGNYNKICIRGRFSLNQTVELERGNTIVLLPGSIITYIGEPAEPAFTFTERYITLKSTGEAPIPIIRSNTPMENGLINIRSEHSPTSDEDTDFARIKDLNLESSAPHDPDNPKNNRGIVIENLPESFVNSNGQGDPKGGAYFVHMTGLSLSGYSVGINLLGASNANNIRDVTMKDIDAYGIWVSGCVDNSINDVRFEQSYNATAIRIDNYIKSAWEYFEAENFIDANGDLFVNPNQTLDFFTDDILAPLIGSAPDQSQFNGSLRALDYYFHDVVAKSCRLIHTDLTNVNEFDVDGNLLRFSLNGLSVDGQPGNIYGNNWPADGKDIKSIFVNPAHPQCDSDPLVHLGLMCLYSKHEYIFNSQSYTLNQTCNNDSYSANFFVRPNFNIFSGVNIYNSNGDIQVGYAVEVQEREDDNDKFIMNAGLSGPDFLECDIGIGNKIYLCPGSEDLSSLILNNTVHSQTTTCPLSTIQSNILVITNDFSTTGLQLSYH